jgi:hypothetical protein
MENTLNEWKLLWQHQAPRLDWTAASAADAGLVDRLRAFEQRQLRINLIKTAALLPLLGGIFYLFVRHAAVTMTSGLGLLLIVGGSLVFLLVYWRHQFRMADLDLDAPPARLIPQAIARLNLHRRLFGLYFPLLGLFLIVGLNLLYVAWLAEAAPGMRWLFHGGMTLFMGLALWAGRRIRRRKFHREYQPLIDELTQNLEELNNEK